VVAVEVDADLAASAGGNLAPWSWVEVRQGDATARFAEAFDAILINAGTTHPQETWLEALRPGGRMVVPFTFEVGPPCPTIGKGLVVLLTKRDDGEFAARVCGAVAIYSGVGLRDRALDDRLREALTRGIPPSIQRLRRDAHEPSASCWLHGSTFCLASA
jgi:protein-L-isoaspartate(D-aspartate) O-methyltransferase